MKTSKRVLLTALVSIVGFYFLMVAGFYFFQEKVLFHPTTDRFEHCSCKDLMPVKTKEDGKLIRYHVHTHDNPQAVFLLLHGNAGTACGRCYYVTNLKELPVDFIIPEFPGFSGDKRGPTEKNWLEETLLIHDYIQEMYEGLPIIVFGESLGTGPATWLASKRKIRGLILQSPYTSISNIGRENYPFLPVELILKHKFNAKNWAQKTKTKNILVIHGKKDRIIPFSNGMKQAKNFPNKPIIEVFEKSGHLNFSLVAPKRYWNIIKNFCNKLISI